MIYTRENVVKMVKAAAAELGERAEDLVSEGPFMNDFNIWLRFPVNGLPEIEVTSTYASEKCFDVILGQTRNM